jgi:hypothetical protein
VGKEKIILYTNKMKEPTKIDSLEIEVHADTRQAVREIKKLQREMSHLKWSMIFKMYFLSLISKRK